MSRRAPNPAAERAAKNQQTIKSLLKLEPNKVCADCKRNKHPRWASWNLGVFICIRCSGVHRGMGTHISRVKSVDLDSWTDEQLQSILSWGNARANKYWEAKLAPGHVPSEAKIENFIRTKYELKRWVMDGPMPDPATLDVEGDDDIPLSIVKEKQTIDRKESLRKSSVGASAAPAGRLHPRAPVVDLIGGGSDAPTISPPPAATRVPSKTTAGVAPPPRTTPTTNTTTHTTTRDSLLGLDFLGSQPAAPARTSSATSGSTSGGTSRPDLKQSILSLYATAPRTHPPAQHAATASGSGGSFGSMHSPTLSQTSGGSGGGGGGFVDAFSSLSFSNTTPAATSPKPVDAFAGLSSLTGSHGARAAAAPAAATTSSSNAFGGLSGGSFFDTKPAAPAAPAKPVASSSTFGVLSGFDAFSSPPAAAAPVVSSSSSNAFGDLFDFGSPAPAAPAATTTTTTTTASKPPPGPSASSMSSVFNLSSPAAHHSAAAAPAAAPQTTPLAAVGANWSNSDVWGGDAWGSSATATTATTTTTAAAPAATTSSLRSPGLGLPAAGTNDFGWGSSVATSSSTHGSFASQSIVPGAGGGFAPAPKVAADEEFGGWTSSTTATTTTTTASGAKQPVSGFGTNEDLFSNVWG